MNFYKTLLEELHAEYNKELNLLQYQLKMTAKFLSEKAPAKNKKPIKFKHIVLPMKMRIFELEKLANTIVLIQMHEEDNESI